MVQCPDSALPLQGAWIQSLVGEQISHKPEVQPKKEKEKKRNFLRGGQRKRILPRILEGTVKAVGKAPRENVKENHLDQL